MPTIATRLASTAVIGFKVVDRAADPPGPGGDGAPVVRLAIGCAGWEVTAADAQRQPREEIGLDVTIVERRVADAAVEEGEDVGMAERPALAGGHTLAVAIPNRPLFDAGVVDRQGVGGEREIQEDRDGAGRFGRDVDEQVDLGAGVVVGEVDRDLPADCLAVEGGRPGIEDVEVHRLGARGGTAELILLEQFEQLGPPFAGPSGGVCDGLSIAKLQRIRERVVADFRLGVVDRDVGDAAIGRVGDLSGGPRRERATRNAVAKASFAYRVTLMLLK